METNQNDFKDKTAANKRFLCTLKRGGVNIVDSF
jgi:hypothetical protein